MYRKNTAGQFVCFQLLLTSSGAVATGLSPAVRRCIDGTFAAGGGSVTEDGSTGAYKYAMAQADTNGNNISFIFSAATAMPVCVNILTTAADPTSGTNFGLSALPTANPGAGGGIFIAGTNAATTITTALTTTFTGNLTGSVGSVTGAVTVGTNNDKTGYALTAAYDPAKTASQAGDAMALTAAERNSTADALLNRDMSTGTDSGSPSVRTVRQALRMLRNKFTLSATTLTVYKEDDTTSSWTSTLTTDATAVPVVTSDPA